MKIKDFFCNEFERKLINLGWITRRLWCFFLNHGSGKLIEMLLIDWIRNLFKSLSKKLFAFPKEKYKFFLASFNKLNSNEKAELISLLTSKDSENIKKIADELATQ